MPPGTSASEVVGDSNQRKPAKRALMAWLELADHITRAGGRILVLDPPQEDIRLCSQDGNYDPVHAGRIGAPFLNPSTGAGPLFLRARGAEGVPDKDRDPICLALAHAGLKVEVAQRRWQGQAELIALPRNRFLLTYGPGSEAASCEEIKPLLPMGARVLCVEMAAGSGMDGITYLKAPSGDGILLVSRAALRSHTPGDLTKFVVGDRIETHILGAEDMAAHATHALSVRGTVLMPEGTSTQLRGYLARRGLQIVTCDVSALFGPEGGGPRALVNEWPGFVLSDDSPSYANRRQELISKVALYGADESA